MQRPNEVGQLRLLSEPQPVKHWMVMLKQWLDMLREKRPHMKARLHYPPPCLWSISTAFTAPMSQRQLFFSKLFKNSLLNCPLKFLLVYSISSLNPTCLEANPSFPPTAYTHTIPPGFPISLLTALSSVALKRKFQPFLVGHQVQYNPPSKNP